MSEKPPPPGPPPNASASGSGGEPPAKEENKEEKLDTGEIGGVLCSLSASYPADSVESSSVGGSSSAVASAGKQKGCGGGGGAKLICSKQHQLPMFLSKTYHMIDKCDPNIATWSEAGDNFVVKNVELFASVSSKHRKCQMKICDASFNPFPRLDLDCAMGNSNGS